jgi:hypothetical protein
MLKDDTTRLCGEIRAMRKMRCSLMDELQQGASELKETVTELCSDFGHARTAMAKQTKHERVAFLNTLKRSVGALRRDLRKDLAGAHKAWAGLSA